MSEQNFIDWRVEMTVRIAEDSRPEKWLVQTVEDALEDGEEVIDYDFTPVSDDVVDYKSDLKAALEQLMLYSSNDVMVIGADGHQYNLLDKYIELQK